MYKPKTNCNEQYGSYIIISEADVSYVYTFIKAHSFFCPSSHRTISIALS